MSWVFLMFAILSLPAEAKLSFCDYSAEGVEKVFYLPFTPNFFFRVGNESERAYFAGGQFVNLKTGEIQKIGLNRFDIVPFPGEEILTLPGSREEGLMFYRTSDVKVNDFKVKPFWNDPSMIGAYQSIARLDNSGRYRIVTGEKVRDYQLSQSSGQFDLKPLAEPEPVCPDRKISMPMLSKDGKLLGGFDETSGTMKIFQLEASGKCQEIRDLGIGVGKVDFSFDSRKILFHKSEKYPGGREFATPAPAWSTRIYELDLVSGDSRQLTYGRGGNDYYPVYRRDGKILFMNGEDTGAATVVYRLVLADPEKLRSTLRENPNWQELVCQHWDGLPNFTGFLKSICGIIDEIAPFQFLQIATSMNASSCRESVKEYFGNQSKFDSELPSKLTAVCDLASNQPVAVFGAPMETDVDGGNIVEGKCMVCHRTGAQGAPIFDKKFQPTKESILERIKHPDPALRMPLGDVLNKAELKVFEEYIKNNPNFRMR